MSLSDPIGDMIASLKNAQMRNHKKVMIPCSNFKIKIVDVLKNEGFIVEVFYVIETKTDTSKRAFDTFKGDIRKINKIPDVVEDSVIMVDCLLGSGVIGQPRSPYKEIIDELNQFENIISVDVPSGFGTPIPVKP